MYSKSRTNRVINLLIRLLTAGLVIALLYFTNLISAASTATQWALLQTGLRDADEEPDPMRADFDFAFTMKDLEGNRFPAETFKGKVIFLNLWATWCGPCRAEMPGIQALYDKVDKQKVEFIMISIDPDEALPKVKKYLKDRSFTFNAYMPAGYLTEQLTVPSIPTTFIVSKDGKIMKKEVGAMQYDTPEFLRFLEKLYE